jgi:hypothetical protein
VCNKHRSSNAALTSAQHVPRSGSFMLRVCVD